jgi:kynurenine formamidase
VLDRNCSLVLLFSVFLLHPLNDVEETDRCSFRGHILCSGTCCSTGAPCWSQWWGNRKEPTTPFWTPRADVRTFGVAADNLQLTYPLSQDSVLIDNLPLAVGKPERTLQYVGFCLSIRPEKGAVVIGFRVNVLVWLLIGCSPVVVAQPASPGAPLSGKWIDLTHSFDESTIYWPTAGGFELSVDQYGMTEKGYFYASKRFAAAEHGGTHLDAPIHFSKNGKSVDQLALDRFIGEALVVDVAEACAGNPDYQVGVDDLHRWEQKHRRQFVEAIVLIHTGFSRHWNDRKKYLGTDQVGPQAVADLHFPGLAPDAAKWLAEHRLVKAIGIDTASIDFGQSERFQSHVTLFQHNIPVFENVADLHRLPAQGARVIALPMKIRTGTGAPLRIIASLPQ